MPGLTQTRGVCRVLSQEKPRDQATRLLALGLGVLRSLLTLHFSLNIDIVTS